MFRQEASAALVRRIDGKVSARCRLGSPLAAEPAEWSVPRPSCPTTDSPKVRQMPYPKQVVDCGDRETPCKPAAARSISFALRAAAASLPPTYATHRTSG